MNRRILTQRTLAFYPNEHPTAARRMAEKPYGMDEDVPDKQRSSHIAGDIGPLAVPHADGYANKLVKFIPADIIGAWLAAKGLILTARDVPTTLILWVAFVLGLVLTFLWTLRQTQLPGHRPALTQCFLSSVAFGVWVMAMGQPFVLNTLYSSLLLILFSLVVPLIDPPER